MIGTMMTPSREGRIDQVVTALWSAPGDRPVSVVLFRSRGAGEVREGSDWDILVISEGLPADPIERGRFLRRVLPLQFGLAVSFLARTPQDFEDHLPSLYGDVSQEIEDGVPQGSECTERSGPEVPLGSDYGDEARWRTPRELFDEDRASTLLELDEKAVNLTQKIIKQGVQL